MRQFEYEYVRPIDQYNSTSVMCLLSVVAHCVCVPVTGERVKFVMFRANHN